MTSRKTTPQQLNSKLRHHSKTTTQQLISKMRTFSFFLFASVSWGVRDQMSTYHRWLASDPTNNTGCSTPAFKRLGVRPCFFARDLGGRVTIEKLTRKQKGEPTTPTLAEKYRKYKIGKWTCLNNSRRERLANLKFYNLTKREVNKFQIFLLLEIRFSSLCEFQLISTKEPQAQRKRYIYRLYVSTAYVNLYIYI